MKKICALVLAGLLLPVSGHATEHHIHRIEKTGDILQFALPALAAGSAAYNGSWASLGRFTRVLGATMATTAILRVSINAERPNGHSYSFPSGHTAAAFSGAVYLAMNNGPAIGVPAMIAATFTGISRVISQNHYPQDVIVGAGIALAYNVRSQSEITRAGFNSRGENGKLQGSGPLVIHSNGRDTMLQGVWQF